MTDSRLAALARAGVSIWLDDLNRPLVADGVLAHLSLERGVSGVTSNPTIFAAALDHGNAYDDQVAALAAQGASVDEAAWALMVSDVRSACDVLRPVHDRTDGVDGRVSLEVDPRLARDVEATTAMAQRLWSTVDRPNLLIKIPATQEGLSSITRTLAAGVSVNATLIFSLDRCRGVMNAFLAGMEQARQAGRDLSTICSVASLFVSRLDTEVDARLDALADPRAAALRGAAAVANARLAYRDHEEVFATPRWATLADDGGRPQRLLWASTGVKDPAYPDTKYVVDLVAPGTVNTMPRATLDALADHGEVTGDTVRGRYAEAEAALDAVSALGVSYPDVTRLLEEQGVAKFEASWRALLSSVERALAGASRTP